MSVILHVSDPHFGTEQPKVVDALVALSRREDPELVILSGDVTQRARRAQFRAARAFVDRLNPRALLVVPGNHDIPLFDLVSRVWSPYAHYAAAFGEDREPVFESTSILAIAVNTTRAYRHKHGEVSADQIDRVRSRLESASDAQLRIVVTHQPVVVTCPEDENNLLRGSRPAITAWCAAGADLILSGHIHLPYVRSLSERVPALPRRAWCVNAGTAVSWRVRGTVPNSVNVIRSEPGECSVERWDFAAHEGAFLPFSSTKLVLDRPGAAEASKTAASRRIGEPSPD
jgi:3',5'-cyclic AMP phosphodiesterase CpdA